MSGPTQSDHTDAHEHTVSKRAMELVVSGLFIAVSLLVMYDNWRIGASWASDGPEAGYFPFYIGLIMLIASLGTFAVHLRGRASDRTTFVARSELKQVLAVLVPTIVYVVVIAWTGIYVASALFIAFFMIVLGKYPIWKVVPISILVPLFLFMMFEVWFLVPLPKGPLEAAFGY